MSLNHRVESVVHSPPYIISPTNCTHIFVDKLLGFSVDFFFSSKRVKREIITKAFWFVLWG